MPERQTDLPFFACNPVAQSLSPSRGRGGRCRWSVLPCGELYQGCRAVLCTGREGHAASGAGPHPPCGPAAPSGRHSSGRWLTLAEGRDWMEGLRRPDMTQWEPPASTRGFSRDVKISYLPHCECFWASALRTLDCLLVLWEDLNAGQRWAMGRDGRWAETTFSLRTSPLHWHWRQPISTMKVGHYAGYFYAGLFFQRREYRVIPSWCQNLRNWFLRRFLGFYISTLSIN